MMRRLTIQVLFCSLIGSLILPQSLAQSRGAATETLIRNATVLTVTRGTLTNADVLIRNGKIVALGKNVRAAANAKVIDATGKFVLPGIVDCHSHSMLDTINEGTLSVTSMARTSTFSSHDVDLSRAGRWRYESNCCMVPRMRLAA